MATHILELHQGKIHR